MHDPHRTSPRPPTRLDTGQRQRERLRRVAKAMRVSVLAGSLVTAGTFTALAARHTTASASASADNTTTIAQAGDATLNVTATPSLFDGQGGAALTPTTGPSATSTSGASAGTISTPGPTATSTPAPTTTPTPKATKTPRVKSSSSH